MTDLPTAEDLAFPEGEAAALVRTALDEDLGPDSLDVTTLATFSPEATATAEVVARADGVVAGLPVVALVFDDVASRLGRPSPRSRSPSRRARASGAATCWPRSPARPRRSSWVSGRC